MDKLVSVLQATAEIYGKQLSHAAALMLLSDLSMFPEAQIMAALSRCRKELRTFPTLADVLLRIEDCRPGVEEAWALCPASEDASTVWTDEIKAAFFEAALPLLDRDPIAARMAFKEKYGALLAAARSAGKSAKWEASLGQDKAGQERALLKAVEQGKLPAPDAQRLLPDISFRHTRHNPQLAALANSALKQIAHEGDEK